MDLVEGTEEIDDDCVVLEKDSAHNSNTGGRMPKVDAHTRSALTTEQLLLRFAVTPSAIRSG
jgi:hypothetical protein